MCCLIFLGCDSKPENADEHNKNSSQPSTEFSAGNCPDFIPPPANQLSLNSGLPNPFVNQNGTVVETRQQWACRRNEIREQAQAYIYGEKPPRPKHVSGDLSDNSINVKVSHRNQTIEFSAELVLPAVGSAPYPTLINVGAKGGYGGITLGEQRILDQGVAIIYFNHYALGKEGKPEASRGLQNPGLFYDLYGGEHSAGLLAAWAWGASRLIDVLYESDQTLIDANSLGVTGCSRNGKGAFAIGLFDDRIALTIAHETSTAGVPAFRIVDKLNTERSDHNYYGLNWLSNNFEPFVMNTAQLPIDTHSLMGVIAPRGLLILDNVHERQMSAPAGFVAASAGAEIYAALGARENISYHSKVENTGHCRYKEAYTALIEQNIRKFLKHEPAATGEFIVGDGGELKVSDWVNWAAPDLK